MKTVPEEDSFRSTEAAKVVKVEDNYPSTVVAMVVEDSFQIEMLKVGSSTIVTMLVDSFLSKVGRERNCPMEAVATSSNVEYGPRQIELDLVFVNMISDS